MDTNDDVTRILKASRLEGHQTTGVLLNTIYDDLRSYARAMLGRNAYGVDPTGIVHEVYLKLVRQEQASFQDRRHFFAVAAQAVRRILVDHARRRATAKRGGDDGRLTIDTHHFAEAAGSDVDVLDLHEALEELGREEPRAAQLVELRFFGGLSIAEASEELGVSASTANIDWRYARAWLYRRLNGS